MVDVGEDPGVTEVVVERHLFEIDLPVVPLEGTITPTRSTVLITLSNRTEGRYGLYQYGEGGPILQMILEGFTRRLEWVDAQGAVITSREFELTEGDVELPERPEEVNGVTSGIRARLLGRNQLL